MQHDDHCIFNYGGRPWRVVGLLGEELFLRDPGGVVAIIRVDDIDWNGYVEAFYAGWYQRERALRLGEIREKRRKVRRAWYAIKRHLRPRDPARAMRRKLAAERRRCKQQYLPPPRLSDLHYGFRVYEKEWVEWLPRLIGLKHERLESKA